MSKLKEALLVQAVCLSHGGCKVSQGKRDEFGDWNAETERLSAWFGTWEEREDKGLLSKQRNSRNRQVFMADLVFLISAIYWASFPVVFPVVLTWKCLNWLRIWVTRGTMCRRHLAVNFQMLTYRQTLEWRGRLRKSQSCTAVTSGK